MTLYRKFRRTKTPNILKVMRGDSGEVVINRLRNYRTTDVNAGEPVIERGKRTTTCKDWRGLIMNLASAPPNVQLQELRECHNAGPIVDFFLIRTAIHTGVKCQ
jgi:hypothetical protein